MDKAAVDRLIVEAGLKKHAKALSKVIRPCALIHHTGRSGDKVPVGAAKLAGAPDVREGFGLAWPVDSSGDTKVPFVAQIPLAEAKAAQPELLLPDVGFLYLFFSEEGGQVAFWDREATAENVKPMALPEAVAYLCEVGTPVEIGFRGVFMAPDNPPDFVFDEDIMHEFIALSEALQLPEDIADHPLHWLGGHAVSVQCEDFSEYTLVAQIDSDAEVGWCWGDMGRLHFLDAEGNSQLGEFADVEVRFECY